MSQEKIKAEGKNLNRKADDNPTGFRFVSLYVGLFDCFERQIMNFCSDYCTTARIVKDVLYLEVKHEKVLPDNFFALNEGNIGNGCVKSVAAIIGINGSGKTTLARLLCNLPASDGRKPKWNITLIYEENGNVKVYSTFPQMKAELKCSNGEKRSVDVECSPLFPFRLFYYSPHFTTEQFDVYTTGYHVDKNTGEEVDVVKDISTTRLMLHPEGNSELLPSVGIRQSSVFDVDEKIRLFEFVAEYKTKSKEFTDKFDIPMPESISIGVHNEGFLLALKEMKGNAERAQIVKSYVQKKRNVSLDGLKDPVGDYLHEVHEAFDHFGKTARQHSFVVNVFMSYAARHIQESGIFGTDFPEKELKNGFLADLKEFIVGGKWAKEREIKIFLKYHHPDLPHKHDENRSDNPMLELIELLQRFCKDSKRQASSSSSIVRIDGNIMNCQLGNQKTMENVCRLVRLHGTTRVISPYLKFDVIPHMSSGEMSFLALFARLYRFVGRVTEGENVVVFLDEAETTLHPEWQRRLVSYSIRFFEVFLPNRQYQLIFSSHSPMLLTDIPRHNVVFLNVVIRNENGEVKKYEIVDDMCNQKAFAANVFELYKDSFVLAKGQMGEFAASKVSNVLAKLKVGSPVDITSDDKMTMQLIDDPFISRYVRSRVGCVDDGNALPEDEIYGTIGRSRA